MPKKEKKQVYMSEGVKKLLIEEDLAADLLMWFKLALLYKDINAK